MNRRSFGIYFHCLGDLPVDPDRQRVIYSVEPWWYNHAFPLCFPPAEYYLLFLFAPSQHLDGTQVVEQKRNLPAGVRLSPVSHPPRECYYGRVKDFCGCCVVCASGEGEDCSALACGEGLRCERRSQEGPRVECAFVNPTGSFVEATGERTPACADSRQKTEERRWNMWPR
ncbi:hypothetical protein WMY93_004127 [Mugilogobius chulae]|uniref:IGFBP N-terminal domain-containing protein n=1 Tax=Mugilogobius chulae TaxID=88201 RepID=A0AAW0PXD3_9GOBI